MFKWPVIYEQLISDVAKDFFGQSLSQISPKKKWSVILAYFSHKKRKIGHFEKRSVYD